MPSIDSMLRIREKLKWNLSKIRFLLFRKIFEEHLIECPDETPVRIFYEMVTGENLTLLHKNISANFSHVKKFLL